MNYCHDYKFLDRQVCANCVDPDQTGPKRAFWSTLVCHSVCIFWKHYFIGKSHCSNFRMTIAFYRVSDFFRVLGASVHDYFRNTNLTTEVTTQ